MIPYGRQDITEEDILSVTNVLRGDFLTQGPIVPQFEEAIAEYCSSEYAVAVSNATAALHIACLALEIGAGDIVWTTPNTFVASANCALYCGATIDFVDIDEFTYNISFDELERKLVAAVASNTLPKLLIVVHYAGQPCDMRAISRLSNRYGFRVIEDASHAIGARYWKNEDDAILTPIDPPVTLFERNQLMVGSCAFSDITIFSFHPVKIITTGEGGMALTNDALLAERLKRLRTHGISYDSIGVDKDNTCEVWNYDQIELGYNYRMTDIQAALGLSQLKRLDQYIARRNEIANYYNNNININGVIVPYKSPTVYSAYHLYPIRVSYTIIKLTQREIYTKLRTAGIGVNIHYIPVHRHSYYQDLGFKEGDFPTAERFHRETITLPIYPNMTLRDQTQIIEALEAVVRG
jgi:dTDP-4-amino-4,6-dideoxygalactose transaminase